LRRFATKKAAFVDTAAATGGKAAGGPELEEDEAGGAEGDEDEDGYDNDDGGPLSKIPCGLDAATGSVKVRSALPAAGRRRRRCLPPPPLPLLSPRTVRLTPP